MSFHFSGRFFSSQSFLGQQIRLRNVKLAGGILKKIIALFLFCVCSGSVVAQACYSSNITDPLTFEGFSGNYETVTLSDGTKWQLTQYSYFYHYEYRAAVTICPTAGTLTVGGRTVNVKSVSPVVLPTNYTFQICNRSNVAVSAAYGRFDTATSTFKSHGWYNVSASSCTNVSVSTTRYRYFYVYAETVGGLVWQDLGSTNKLCIDPVNAFETVTGNCAARGLVEKNFIEVDTGTSGTLYTYNLTATNVSQTIGAITFQPSTLTVGGTTSVSASATSGLGVTFTSTTSNVCLVFGSTVMGVTAGTCVIAANQSGNTTYAAATQVTQSIAVTAPVAPPVCTVVAAPPSITSGSASTLTASCSPVATSYIWTGGTCAGKTAATCTVSPTVTTTYTFAGVNASGTGVAATATVTVTTPVSSCTLAAVPASIVAGGTSVLTATCSPTATSFVWTGGSCAGTTSTTCTVTPTATTTYTVSGVNAAGTGTSANATVAVQTPSVPVCTVTATPASIAAGETSVLTASCAPAATSFVWTGGTCAGVSGTTCTVKPSATSTYTVAGVNASGAGTTASVTVAVTLPGSPACKLNASPVVVSAGGSVTLIATCAPAATSYAWTNGIIDAASSNGKVTPSKTTVYSVVGSNASGSGAEASAAVYVCDTPPPGNYAGLTLSGTTDNDSLSGGITSDTIDGGPGFDTVIYQCNKDSFTITKTAAGWVISSAAEGIDSLVNVERIKFGDRTLALDITGNAGQAYRIYQAAFNRVPDNGGLKFWISSMDAGATLRDVATGFVGSPEFQSVYGSNPTNEQFVVKLYNNVLHRDPDAGGKAYWLDLMDRGLLGKVDVLMQFSESPENQAGVLNAIINGIDLLN